jgi:hypothetical protein
VSSAARAARVVMERLVSAVNDQGVVVLGYFFVNNIRRLFVCGRKSINVLASSFTQHSVYTYNVLIVPLPGSYKYANPNGIISFGPSTCCMLISMQNGILGRSASFASQWQLANVLLHVPYPHRGGGTTPIAAGLSCPSPVKLFLCVYLISQQPRETD